MSWSTDATWTAAGRARVAGWAGLALALAACGDGSAPADADADAPEARSVRTVEVSWASLPLLDSVTGPARYTIGPGGDASVELHGVRDAVLLSTGAIAVAWEGEGGGGAGEGGAGAEGGKADEGAEEATAGPRPALAVFDTASGALTTFGSGGEGSGGEGSGGEGSRGDGSGGLASAAGLHDEGGGRVGVFDPAAERYVVWGADGAPDTPVSLSELGLPPSPSYRKGPGGAFWAAPFARPPEDPAVERVSVPVVRATPGSADTVARLPGPRLYRGPAGPGLVLFGPSSTLAPAPSGVWMGDMDRPEVFLLDPGGDTLAVIRWTDGPDRALTDAWLDEALDPVFERLPRNVRRAARRQMMEFMPVPDSVPFFQHLVVDREGRLWIGSYVAPEVPGLGRPARRREWMVVDAGGRPAGRVVTPPRFRLTAAGRDWVLGVETDELGVERVRLYAH